MNGVVAVTGATGYIGGRLVPLLLADGHRVRILTRDATKLRDTPWRSQVDIVAGSLDDAQATASLCRNAAVVYYLVHSMSGAAGFERTERACALTLGKAARDAGVGRIIYLSGLHPNGTLSRHLASRREVGEILLASGVPTAVLQAGLVIGSGSASFEMIRHLTDVLPVMPAPRWVMNEVQPIAVRDALHYLVGAADLPADVSGTFDIAGPGVLTYAQILCTYAQVAGIRRPLVLPLPVLTPWLADPLPSDPDWTGQTVFTDVREQRSTASAERVRNVVERIGGESGWYSLPWAWTVRGWMDKIAGGVGLSRGRRSRNQLHLNDVVDWWRVEALDRGELLRLRAEMKVPGRAWLELRVEPHPESGSTYRQRAIFFPRGLAGRLYRLTVLPFHGLIFKNMAAGITAAAQADQ